MKVTCDCEAALEKTVCVLNATSGRVYLPKKWVGRKVKILLLEED